MLYFVGPLLHMVPYCCNCCIKNGCSAVLRCGSGYGSGGRAVLGDGKSGMVNKFFLVAAI